MSRRAAARRPLARAPLRAWIRMLALAVPLAALASSCAYYNTFYLARKYYDRGTGGEPYTVDKAQGGNLQEFGRSAEYSKKVLSQYPKSKWVDDAYLLWARSLLGQDDPLQTVKMLEEFDTRFPKSNLKPDAKFYLGVAYRQGRKHQTAVRTLDEFLEKSPKHDMAPYAYLEKSRAYMSLDDPAAAAKAASEVVERWPKHKLADKARVARADALFEAKQYDAARADYHDMGRRSENDEDRLRYLLREVDALEANRQYDQALALLRDALSHVREPLPPDTTGGRAAVVTPSTGYDHWGRLTNRYGTVLVRSGRMDEGLAAYERVVRDYPRDPLAGEAQFLIGYAWETNGDDFEKARTEYSRVKDQVGQTGFGAQANDRLKNLDRIAQFRTTATGDSATLQAETIFLTAEQYLFELDKPERALDEYVKVARDYAGQPVAGRALNAQAWVLSRKMNRKAQADSLYWKVVREYPATEAQLAARDYLEADGQTVPSELIKLPEVLTPVPDSVALTEPPQDVPDLGELRPVATFEELGSRPRSPGGRLRIDEWGPGFTNETPGATAENHPNTHVAPSSGRSGAPADTTHRRATLPDTTHHAAPPVHTAPPDTTHHAAPPDTSHAAPPHTPAPSDTTHKTPAPSDTTRKATGGVPLPGPPPGSTSPDTTRTFVGPPPPRDSTKAPH